MKNTELLKRAEDSWLSLSEFRDTRRRNINYIYGDQWSDLVMDDDGRMVTERERIARKTGAVPLQNNHLIKIVHALTGLVAKNAALPVCKVKNSGTSAAGYPRQNPATSVSASLSAYALTPSETPASPEGGEYPASPAMTSPESAAPPPAAIANSDAPMQPADWLDPLSRMMTDALQDNWMLNGMKELMISQMEELMHGGVAVVCEEWGMNRGLRDSYTYSINPDYFFFESKMNDPRMWDVGLIGEIRDYKIGELVSKLQHTGIDYDRLKQIYGIHASQASFFSSDAQLTSRHENMDFYHAPAESLCRTYHVWTYQHRLLYRCVDRMDHERPVFKIKPDDLKAVKEENRRRQKRQKRRNTCGQDEMCRIEYEPTYEPVWHFTLLAPDATVLQEYDSPYAHAEHPYIMTAYHFVNGRIFPFMGTVIDQQRYINRLITLNDMFINSSIKGLKIIPKRAIPRDMSLEEFARQAVEVGGWIVYEPDPTGAKPEIITQGSNNLGVTDMLNLQISSINEITSVNESLQGIPPQANTGYQRYAMEMENSSTSVAAMTSKFVEFQLQVARKKMKVIQQFSLSAPSADTEYNIQMM